MRHSTSSAMLLSALAATAFIISCSKNIEANDLSAVTQERNNTTITINIGANGFNTTIEQLTRIITNLTDVSSINPSTSGSPTTKISLRYIEPTPTPHTARRPSPSANERPTNS